MIKPVILCIEDEPEVREAVVRDLSEFEALFQIEEAEDIPEAREIVEASLKAGTPVALVFCDHVLPGENGVGTLQHKFLEKSNVEVVNELVNLIIAQRAYEINSRAIRTGDDMLALANNLTN